MSAALMVDAEIDTSPLVDREASVLVPGLLLGGFMLIGIAVVWGAVYLAMRWRAAGTTPVPASRSLLERLCGAHALPAADLQQLKAVAAQRSLMDPALLLIDPRLLEAYAGEHPASAEWTARIGQRLFGPVFQTPGTAVVEEQSGIA